MQMQICSTTLKKTCGNFPSFNLLLLLAVYFFIYSNNFSLFLPAGILEKISARIFATPPLSPIKNARILAVYYQYTNLANILIKSIFRIRIFGKLAQLVVE